MELINGNETISLSKQHEINSVTFSNLFGKNVLLTTKAREITPKGIHSDAGEIMNGWLFGLVFTWNKLLKKKTKLEFEIAYKKWKLWEFGPVRKTPTSFTVQKGL